MEPQSTYRPRGLSTFLASCTPELWIESSETETSQAIDYWQQNTVGRYAVQISVVALAYFIAGKLGQATISIRSSNLGPVWPAYGIALSSILLYGYRAWIGVAVGAFLVAFLSPVTHFAAVGQAAGATVAALTGTFLLRRVADFHPSLARLRDALGLIVFGAFGSAIVSASVGVFSLQATHVKAYFGAGSAWLIYWLGDSTGVLLVTPLVLTLPSLLRIRSRASIGELAALLMFLIATCFVLFGDLTSIPVKFHVLAFAVLPFVMWAAIKFGTGGACLSILVTATVATVETAYGRGPFAGNAPFMNAVLLDVFFSVLAVSGLTLAAVIAERDQAAQKLTEEKLREYRNAVEGAEEMIAVVDREYRYVIANRRFLEYRNMKKDEVVGRLVPEVLNKGVFEAIVKEKLDRAFAGEVVRYEMKYTYPGFGERDLFISNFPIAGPAGVDRVAIIPQDVTERRRAEEAIRESEKRFRVVANTTPVMIWMAGTDKKSTYFNQPWLDFTGLSESDLMSGLADVVHPEDYQKSLETYVHAFDQRQPFKKECRLRRHDGQYRWMLDIGVPRFHEDGSFAGYIGSCVDVSDSKEAEEALTNVSRRLIEAHEQERTWVARELHDDITQRLALTAIELDWLKQNPPSSVEFLDRVDAVSKRVSELVSDTQSMAHRLHSSKLEYLGLGGATEGFCKELAKKHDVEIDFHQTGPLAQLPQDVSLCLFRVLQEALSNALKHSGARRVKVELTRTVNEVELIVSDAGQGFCPEDALKSQGLGLVSMRERLHLVGGQISIHSQPSCGATIHARVPFRSDQSFAASAD
jgi:PAS domain S-box-containing protein